jgi:hypothetical protein
MVQFFKKKKQNAKNKTKQNPSKQELDKKNSEFLMYFIMYNSLNDNYFSYEQCYDVAKFSDEFRKFCHTQVLPFSY